MQALENLRVLDLSKMLPGNYCGMLLADYGAEVIKVELPGKEDPVRSFQPQKEGLSYWHIALNRNKKSLTLDYKSEAGKEILFELVKEADVIIESSRPGLMDKWGMSYDEMKKVNEKIIYCSLTGYGQNGKYSTRAVHDINIAGLTGTNYEEGKEPIVSHIQDAGLGGALHAAFAILVAVNARNLTGKGQYIDISLMRSNLSLLTVGFSNYRGVEETGIPFHPRRTPNYTTYKTKDGKYFTVGAHEKKFWQKLCEIVKADDLKDKLFEFENYDNVTDEMQKIFMQKTRSEWEEVFAGEDICVTGVYSFLEAAEKGCFEEHDMVVDLSDERLGAYKQIGSPVIMSDTPSVFDRRAPYPGEDNKELLSLLGFSEEEIAQLHKNGII